jgi:hypothetical protein
MTRKDSVADTRHALEATVLTDHQVFTRLHSILGSSVFGVGTCHTVLVYLIILEHLHEHDGGHLYQVVCFLCTA